VVPPRLRALPVSEFYDEDFTPAERYHSIVTSLAKFNRDGPCPKPRFWLADGPSKCVIEAAEGTARGYAYAWFDRPFPAFLPPDLRNIDIAALNGLLMDGYDREALGWAPVATVADHTTLVPQLRRLAEHKTLFGCDGLKCFGVVPAAVPAKRVGVEVLSVCRFTVLGTILGPPEGCEPLLFREDESTWLRIIATVPRLAGPSGIPDQVSLTGLAAAEVLELIEAALAGGDLSLRTRRNAAAVVGVATPRESRVPGIRPWWEDLSVTVLVEPGGYSDQSLLAMTYVSVLLCRRDEEPPAAWRGPTRTQEQAYFSLLRLAILRKATEVCKAKGLRPSFIGSTRFYCTKE
jgi:hypothetical protein